MMKQNQCQRCGRCCIDIGTIFVHSEHPIIKAILASVPDDFFRDDGPCPMLEISSGKPAICLIEKHLGRKFKPDVCREYPEDGLCFRAKSSLKILE